MSKRWYAYTGDEGEELTINRYRLASGFPGGCNSGYFVCAIYAAYGGTNPATLAGNLENYIALVKANGTNQPDSIHGGGRLFAYGKTVS
jgi:hypothetical protein